MDFAHLIVVCSLFTIVKLVKSEESYVVKVKS